MWKNNNLRLEAKPAKCSLNRGVVKGSGRSGSSAVPVTLTTASVAQPRHDAPYDPNYPLPNVPQRLLKKSGKREKLADIAERIPLCVMRNFFDFPLRTSAEVRTGNALTYKIPGTVL